MPALLRVTALVIVPLALLAGCTAAPTTSSLETSEPAPAPSESEAPEFVPVPERELVTIYDDPFDDNSGDWLEPDEEGNQITGGEFVLESIAGFSTRWIGNVPLALMPLEEVAATVEFSGQGLSEVGLYCRLDRGFNQHYRFTVGESGVRISKAAEENEPSIDLFKAPTPALDPNPAGTMRMECFAESDGFHIDAFLDGELVAQAIDTDLPPGGGIVRVSWAYLPPGSEGPHIFRMSSFTLETRA